MRGGKKVIMGIFSDVLRWIINPCLHAFIATTNLESVMRLCWVTATNTSEASGWRHRCGGEG